MISITEEKLPDFTQLVKKGQDKILIHQDSFAADYHEDEFSLLGMAIKYADIHKREIVIISE